ncbi:hypothetical protein CJF32_00006429 [Rutstroemia sp. NJR-2017a WRK4]|nr:hypothetical protein CJF32_00006429 [Rutstroemia sp. NJR-2017a WRK4]
MAPQFSLPTGGPISNFVPQFNTSQFHTQIDSHQSFTSVESGDSQESFRTQVPLPYYLPTEYETHSHPPPYTTPELDPSHASAQFPKFENSNMGPAMMNPNAAVWTSNNPLTGGIQLQQQGMGVIPSVGYMQRGNPGIGLNHTFNGMSPQYPPQPPHYSAPYQSGSQIGGPVTNYQSVQQQQQRIPLQPPFQEQQYNGNANAYSPYQSPQAGLQPHQLYNGGSYRGGGPPTSPLTASFPNGGQFGAMNGASSNGAYNNGHMKSTSQNGAFRPVSNTQNAVMTRKSSYAPSPTDTSNPNQNYQPHKQYSQSQATAQITSTTSQAGADQSAHTHSDAGSLEVENTPATDRRLSFSSEPRPNSTPLLRSRRGQSVTAVSADRHQSVADWVNETPTRTTRSSTTSSVMLDTTRTPAPMLEQIIEAGGESKENTPGERSKLPAIDTGNGKGNVMIPAPRALAVNPFNTVNTLAPYTGSRFAPAAGMSPLLRSLTRNGTYVPTADEALDSHYLPFVEYCRQTKPAQWGVIKIKNIPYGVTRQEILAFLGRNARIVAENDYEPVHIIMERVTSKTLDAYIEFISFTEASNAVQRFDMNRVGGRGGRLGQRHVEVELSSQEQLMKELFPKAKNVKWVGARPEIIPRDPDDKYNSGFQGFVSREEMVMLVKHVESPQRSPFSKECPQRPFECLVSTLLKFPWYRVEYITCADRQMLYKATVQLLELLVERVENSEDPINLNGQLLKRVWRTALRCEGFSPTMKDNIVYRMNIDPQLALELGVPPKADLWSYVWCIGPRKDVSYDLVEYYIKLIQDATAEKKQMTLAEKAASQANEVPRLPNIFGNMDKLIDYSDAMNRTLAEMAALEWNALEQILRQALTPALEAGPSA